MKKYAPLISIFIIIASIYWGFSDMTPSYKEGNIVSLKEFSTENALHHLRKISKKAHYTGSTNHLEVQEYIVRELKKLGLAPEVQQQVAINSKWRAGTHTANIIASIKGSEKGKALAVLTHYDSSPHSSLGASDAGSGVVTILEGVRAFLAQNKTPKNDIHIVITDAEELGLLGAKAFIEKHRIAKNIGLALNFEARGSGGPSYMLMETTSKNSKLLSEFTNANPNNPVANSLMYSIYKMLPNDTDLTIFRENGKINGFNFAFIGDHFDYHTAQDSFERLDRESLVHQADYLMSMLKYFSNANLSNLESTEDYVYTNFPFTSLLQYPFSWILPLLIGSIVLLMAILFFGIALNRITIKGVLKGFTPFTISLISCTGLTLLLWKGILFIHPHYNDMLHGFTYNGYEYIAAFTMLNIWLLFKIYKPYFKKYNGNDLLIAPLIFWIVLNAVIYIYLQGAAYFIIPVYFALLTVLIFVVTSMRKAQKIITSTVLATPLMYMFSPQIKIFPVGLGLENLFISALFIVLIFGLLTPIFTAYRSRKLLLNIAGLSTLFLFGFATYNSNFSKDRKKPNSIVFIQDINSKQSYWASYDSTPDLFTAQFLGSNPTQGNITGSTSKSKYNNAYRYHTKTAQRNIPTPIITKTIDSVINGFRTISLDIKPQRVVQKIELIANEPITFRTLGAQDVFIDKKNSDDFINIKRGTILSFYLTERDSILKVDFSTKTTATPNISIIESSFDLLENPLFNIQPRTDAMMPMPFVLNDAVITVQKLDL